MRSVKSVNLYSSDASRHVHVCACRRACDRVGMLIVFVVAERERARVCDDHDDDQYRKCASTKHRRGTIEREEKPRARAMHVRKLSDIMVIIT